MNFFGHAAVARLFDREPLFVLGAMLPDFWRMLALGGAPPATGSVGDGVRFHHLTDHAFHELPVFRELSRAATADLDARHVRRGTARAVGHVGIELLLDGELARDAEARAAYLSALRAGQHAELTTGRTATQGEGDRLTRLLETLAQRGVTERPPAAVVVERLGRALHTHPRLALGSQDAPAVSDWVELFRDRVVASAPALVSELVSDLRHRLAA